MRLSTLILVLASSATAFGGNQFFHLLGENANNHQGGVVRAAGDLDLDGYRDVIVGAPGDVSGRVVVYSGRNGAVLREWSDGARFGAALAGDGDSDGDGHPDVLVGGRDTISLFSGRTGGLMFSQTEADTALGASLDFIGDVSGDGYDDFIVGVPEAEPDGITRQGEVRIYAGVNHNVLRRWKGKSVADFMGYQVRAAGDVNADGTPDVLISSHQTVGLARVAAVNVYSTSGPHVRLVTGTIVSQFGVSLAGAVDVDLDGHDDFIVGAPQDSTSFSSAGAAYVYSGKLGNLLFALHGDATLHFLGLAVGFTSDLDGDGRAELLIGSPYEKITKGPIFFNGAVHVCSGQDGTSLRTLTGSPLKSFAFGWSVDDLGDINGDGTLDFAVGDPNEQNDQGSWVGAAYVFSGRDHAGTASSYGQGWPGSLGVPSLTTIGNPDLCEPFTLHLDNSHGAATFAVLFAGFAPADLPTAWGGHLLVMPSLTFTFALPAAGLAIPVTFCDSAFAGWSVDLQALEVDGGASHGVSFTPGLELTFGLRF